MLDMILDNKGPAVSFLGNGHFTSVFGGIAMTDGCWSSLDGLEGCRTRDEDHELRYIDARVFADVLLENTRLRKEMRRLQYELVHVGRATDELAASLAHEIKQPIAAAVSNAEACVQWLAHDQPDLPEVREAATEMVKEARRAVEIMNRIRSLFKKEEMKREVMDLNAVITDTVSLIRGEADRCSISLRTELDVELPKISADPVQLQQALMNLMVNGMDAMKDTGDELTVRSNRTEEGQVLIAVSDRGVGLPAEGTEHIFEAFFTTKPEGTGLGLSISRTIIESHGGRLWASANAGRGATLQFTLPAL
ncbi:MAG TPA: ATP-binding protein [Acidobacteriaceae bacterium]